MKKILIFVLLFFCFIVLNNSNNSYSFSVSNKVYKADNITLKTETGFSVSNGYLFGIEPERSVSDFDLGLDSTYTTSIFSESGSSKTSGYIFTGDKIQIKSSGTTVAEYTIVINGDNNGDGKISPLDYIRIKNHIMSNGLITEPAFAYAADYNDDNNITPLDYIKIKNYIMNRSATKNSITYNSNGGTGSVSKQDVVKDETTNTRRNKFTKDNYVFKNWNTKADGSGTSYNEVAKIKVTSNITLYAQWQPNGVSVTFASFNVGYFVCGSSSISCQAKPDNIVSLINDNKIDIIGMQEARNTSKASSGSCYYSTDNVNSIKNKLNYNGYITCPANVNAILSKYSFKSSSKTSMSCGETRSLDKVVVTINGVDISFYNSHLGLNNCNEEHFQKVANIIKDDPNPVVMTADFNYIYTGRFDTYLKPLGFEIAAYDTLSHNMWGKPSYCDMVIVIPKGHIDIISSKTIDAYGTYSDHNLVIANLSIH